MKTKVLISALLFYLLCVPFSSFANQQTESKSVPHKSSEAVRKKETKNVKKTESKKVYKAVGGASFYGKKFHGKKTASGQKFNMHAMTAAHKTLPFNTKVKVKNLKNGKEVIVTIIDRGPSSKGRIIDVSYAAAKKLGMINAGVIKVEVTTKLD